MDWYVVDKKYINYLTQFDSRVGYVEYGERLKLHVGIFLLSEIPTTMSLFPLQNQSTRRCPTVWIFTNSRMNPLDIFMLY